MNLEQFLEACETPIESLEEAKDFLDLMLDSGCMFHLEDNPENIIDDNGDPLFPTSSLNLINMRIDDLYLFNWDDFDCPIGYCIHIMENN